MKSSRTHSTSDAPKEISNKAKVIEKSDDESYHIGHRSRMRKKFSFHRSAFLNYELLELLLFHVFPRKDTKCISKRLLSHFKTLKNIMSAEATELKKIPGIGDTAAVLFGVIHEIFNRIHLEQIVESTNISSSGQVISYYKSLLEHEKKEQLRVMFLSNKNKLLMEEVMCVGTINHTAIYPREIIQRALEYGASAMILVHNHPSGDPQPSRQDIMITKIIGDVAQKLDILLLDHLIIGKNSSKSLKELGLI